MLSPGLRERVSSGRTTRPNATTNSATPSAVLTTPCRPTPVPSVLSSTTPRKADGMEPITSHFTSSLFTEPRWKCTLPPIGFMIIEATMSLDTAASGSILNSSTKMGVINAPPPMPVRPTTKPTNRPAKATIGSIARRS